MKSVSRIVCALFALSLAAPAIALAVEGGAEHAAPHAPDINWTEGLFDLSHQKKDAQGGSLDPGEAPMNPPFLAVLINFTIFVGLLVWKAGPPISRYLTRRHEDVKGALEESARMQREASEVLAGRKAKLGEVDREVDELITGMRTDAESEKKRMVADAETAAAALKRDADERIAASATRARLAIELEVIGAAITEAEKLIREQSTEGDHNTLVESFIESLTNGTFGPQTPTAGDDGGDPSVDEGWS
jgi:F-type H+-transporting ATPase subunit b